MYNFRPRKRTIASEDHLQEAKRAKLDCPPRRTRSARSKSSVVEPLTSENLQRLQQSMPSSSGTRMNGGRSSNANTSRTHRSAATSRPSASLSSRSSHKSRNSSSQDSTYAADLPQLLTDGGVLHPSRSEHPANMAVLLQRINVERPNIPVMSREQHEAERRGLEELDSESGLTTRLLHHMYPATTHGGTSMIYGRALRGPLLSEDLPRGVPDAYEGISRDSLPPGLAASMGDRLVQSQDMNTVAPNFFVEMKGHRGSYGSGPLQARIYGAMGSQGQNELRAYGRPSQQHDGHARSFTAIVSPETVTVYAHHTSVHNGRPRHHMNMLDSAAWRGSARAFHDGQRLMANVRDMALDARQDSLDRATESIMSQQVDHAAQMSGRGSATAVDEPG